MPWRFVIAMPAVSLPAAIEAGNTAVIPHTDVRYAEVLASHPSAPQFLGSFRTAFAQPLHPAIVVRDAAVPNITTDDLAALRNGIAASAAIQAREQRCNHHFGGMGPVYTDLFELYPVQIGADGETLVVWTGAEHGLDDPIEQFQGQPHPAYIYPESVSVEFDRELLDSFLALWKHEDEGDGERRFRRRTFRSMEFAYHALASPFRHLGSEQDHALALSLWVAAFEVLCAKKNRVSIKDVLRRISQTRWLTPGLSDTYVESAYGPRPRPPVTRAGQVYQRLYRVRNQSLHGGTIDAGLIKKHHDVPEPAGDAVDDLEAELLAAVEWNDLRVSVPALYRGVLLDFLTDAGFHSYPVEPDGWEEYGDYLEKREPYIESEQPLARRCRR